MHRTLKILLFFSLYHCYNFSMDRQDSNRLDRSLTRSSSQETVYPYRDNCCAVCVRTISGDEDGCQVSRVTRCFAVGCLLCTGCFAIVTAFAWVAYHKRTNPS